MATKIGPLNQHEYLHPHYGVHDCCLCKAEERIKDLELELATAKVAIKEYRKYIDYIDGILT